MGLFDSTRVDLKMFRDRIQKNKDSVIAIVGWVKSKLDYGLTTRDVESDKGDDDPGVQILRYHAQDKSFSPRREANTFSGVLLNHALHPDVPVEMLSLLPPRDLTCSMRKGDDDTLYFSAQNHSGNIPYASAFAEIDNMEKLLFSDWRDANKDWRSGNEDDKLVKKFRNHRERRLAAHFIKLLADAHGLAEQVDSTMRCDKDVMSITIDKDFMKRLAHLEETMQFNISRGQQ